MLLQTNQFLLSCDRRGAHTTGTPLFLQGERTRKGTTGGSEGDSRAISFSTQPHIATRKCCGLSNLTMSLTESVRCRLNSTAFEMLSKITGRSIADEARRLSLDVLMRAKDERWNYLGHILKMELPGVTRQVLLQCVKPNPETLLGDIPDLDVFTSTNFATNRAEWKKIRPSTEG